MQLAARFVNPPRSYLTRWSLPVLEDQFILHLQISLIMDRFSQLRVSLLHRTLTRGSRDLFLPLSFLETWIESEANIGLQVNHHRWCVPVAPVGGPVPLLLLQVPIYPAYALCGLRFLVLREGRISGGSFRLSIELCLFPLCAPEVRNHLPVVGRVVRLRTSFSPVKPIVGYLLRLF